MLLLRLPLFFLNELPINLERIHTINVFLYLVNVSAAVLHWFIGWLILQNPFIVFYIKTHKTIEFYTLSNPIQYFFGINDFSPKTQYLMSHGLHLSQIISGSAFIFKTNQVEMALCNASLFDKPYTSHKFVNLSKCDQYVSFVSWQRYNVFYFIFIDL